MRRNLFIGLLVTIIVAGALFAATRRPTPAEFDTLVDSRYNLQQQLTGFIQLGLNKGTNVSEYGPRTIFMNPGYLTAGDTVVVDLPVSTNRNVGLTYRFIARGTNLFVLTNDFNQSIQATNTKVPVVVWLSTNSTVEVMSTGTNWQIISHNQNVTTTK